MSTNFLFMTKYGRSPWIDRFPKSRVPSYPRHHGSHETDVVVVGGGLTGCATAYAFAAAGIKVVLVEAAQIGRGAADLDRLDRRRSRRELRWRQSSCRPARRASRLASMAARRARFHGAVRRLDLKCQLEPRPLSTRRRHRSRPRFSSANRKRARMPVSTRLAERAAILARPPSRPLAASGLATARQSIRIVPPSAWPTQRPIAARGCSSGRRQADQLRPAHRRRRPRRRQYPRERVVVATGRPTPLFKSLIRHFWFKTSFLAMTAPVPANPQTVRPPRGGRSRPRAAASCRPLGGR